MKIIKFLDSKCEYSNLSMIVRGVAWAIYGMIMWNLFN